MLLLFFLNKSTMLNMTVLLEMKNNIVSVSWNKTNVVLNCHIYRATNKNGKYSKIKNKRKPRDIDFNEVKR